MSSGAKILQVNPLERALSTDIMRLQFLADAAHSEVWRALVDTSQGLDDVNAGGAYLPNTIAGNPAIAEVFAGFLFTPTNASTQSAISPGTAFFYDPDTTPNPDDSQYKCIEDFNGTNSTLTPGIALTANASGSIRIDVLECSRVQPDAVVETDNRDIFNTVTGTFTTITVNKVTQSQLTYRIRLGSPGAGFPGTANDWLPLCVMSVPTGTTTWDTVTIWDVRPLMSDRVNVSNVGFDVPRGRGGMSYQFATVSKMSGIVDVAVGTRRLGGRLSRGSPGPDQVGGIESYYIDFTDTNNQEQSMSTANGLKHIYLLTPFGLPRWARYTDAAAGLRAPRNPRGIPLLSTVPPTHATGVPSSGVVFPAIFGFNGANTSSGACIGSLYQLSTVLLQQICSAGKVSLGTAQVPAVNGTAMGTLSTPSTFTVTENIQFPSGVRRIHCLMTISLTVASSGDGYELQPVVNVSMLTPFAGFVAQTQLGTQVLMASGSTTAAPTWEFWIELPNDYPFSLTPGQYQIITQFNGQGATNPGTTINAPPQLQVLGWEYGDC